MTDEEYDELKNIAYKIACRMLEGHEHDDNDEYQAELDKVKGRIHTVVETGIYEADIACS